ncbi:hypothetical protein HGM15179_018863 [Zosterops borbonicus]|uniref:Murine leukemia virus integrase C-terminal domain-containing protein n=1 Tax=Zosterops borbonicus TaxID=364589 RepID=A0A8K1FYD7_9PASS|nr:hypothetical protein HGM15179_018863 [Zosterops borbonicus]
MRAQDLSKGKKVNIWIDSKYAFSVVHAHGAIWKEKGLLNAQGEIHMKGKLDLQRYLMALGSTLQKLQTYIVLSRPIGLDTPAHPFQPGDWVYVNWWVNDPPQSKWRGPFQVLLTTLTAVKVAGKGPWIHYSRVKKASAPETTVKT